MPLRAAPFSCGLRRWLGVSTRTLTRFFGRRRLSCSLANWRAPGWRSSIGTTSSRLFALGTAFNKKAVLRALYLCFHGWRGLAEQSQAVADDLGAVFEAGVQAGLDVEVTLRLDRLE